MGLTTFSFPECSCQGSDYPVFGPELVPEQSQLADVYGEIVGTSTALRRVMQLTDMVAGGDSTTLLLGETGTGKELIARAIHNRSPRRDRPFVKLNCAAIPSGLLESELFGQDRKSVV